MSNVQHHSSSQALVSEGLSTDSSLSPPLAISLLHQPQLERAGTQQTQIRRQSADLYTPSAQGDPLTTVRSCESQHSRPVKFKQHRFLQIETVIFFQVSNINHSVLQQQ